MTIQSGKLDQWVGVLGLVIEGVRAISRIVDLGQGKDATMVLTAIKSVLASISKTVDGKITSAKAHEELTKVVDGVAGHNAKIDVEADEKYGKK